MWQKRVSFAWWLVSLRERVSCSVVLKGREVETLLHNEMVASLGRCSSRAQSGGGSKSGQGHTGLLNPVYIHCM